MYNEPNTGKLSIEQQFEANLKDIAEMNQEQQIGSFSSEQYVQFAIELAQRYEMVYRYVMARDTLHSLYKFDTYCQDHIRIILARADIAFKANMPCDFPMDTRLLQELSDLIDQNSNGNLYVLARSLVHRGMAYAYRGEFTYAHQDLQRAYKTEAAGTFYHKGMAYTYYRKNELDQALRELDHVQIQRSGSGTEDFISLRLRGEIYLKKNDPRRALYYLKRIAEYQPPDGAYERCCRDLLTTKLLALAYYANNQYDEALFYADCIALKRDYDHYFESSIVDYKHNLVQMRIMIYLKQNNLKKACEWADTPERYQWISNWTNRQYQSEINDYMQQGEAYLIRRNSKASLHFNKVLSLNPFHFGASSNLAILAIRTPSKKNSNTLIEKLVKNYLPNNDHKPYVEKVIDSVVECLNTYYAAGRFPINKIVWCYDSTYKLAKKYQIEIDRLPILPILMFEAFRWIEARKPSNSKIYIECVKNLATTQDYTASLYALLAAYHLESNNFALADSSLTQALQLQADNSFALFYRAVYIYRCNQNSELKMALTMLNQVIANEPHNTFALDHRSQIHLKLRDQQSANNDYDAIHSVINYGKAYTVKHN